MARISLYLDEHIQSSLAEALTGRGVDVLTTQQAGNIGNDDAHQLLFATANKRSILSFNIRHFSKLHYQWMAARKSHAGIILSDQLTVGVLLRRLMKLYYSLNSGDMRNRLEYLSAWK